MSLLKADQVRRNLFVKYSQQIGELLGEVEDGHSILPQESDADGGENQEEEEEDDDEEEREEVLHQPIVTPLSKRFRISYARQHLLRQRALRLPSNDTRVSGGVDASSSSVSASASTSTARPEMAAAGDESGEKTEVEDECWRLAYNDPYPSVRRLMRRVQDESLRMLIREARSPPNAYRGDDYAAQRMTVLQQIEEQIGKERITLLARQQKMDGKLHPIE